MQQFTKGFFRLIKGIKAALKKHHKNFDMFFQED